MKEFTVVISVYKSDQPSYFNTAIESLLNQTVLPDEIIIVVDGKITDELEVVLSNFSSNSLIKIFRLEQNLGLALSRNYAISKSSHAIIAVMDSDDISVPDRFQKQLNLIERGEAQVVGGWINEFTKTPKDTNCIRKTVVTHNEILSFGKWRNPINHVTLMFTKDAYEKVGGYSAIRHTEDWEMIARMIVSGVIVRNIPEVLVHVRAGDDMIDRRRDISQFKGELKVCLMMHKIGYIGTVNLAILIIIKLTLIILPRSLTRFTYLSFLRN